MKNLTRHTGTLHIIKRLPSSINGNPRYRISVDGWTCSTIPDSGFAYSITNYEGRQVEATIGTHYGAAALHSIGLVR